MLYQLTVKCSTCGFRVRSQFAFYLDAEGSNPIAGPDPNSIKLRSRACGLKRDLCCSASYSGSLFADGANKAFETLSFPGPQFSYLSCCSWSEGPKLRCRCCWGLQERRVYRSLAVELSFCCALPSCSSGNNFWSIWERRAVPLGEPMKYLVPPFVHANPSLPLV